MRYMSPASDEVAVPLEVRLQPQAPGRGMGLVVVVVGVGGPVGPPKVLQEQGHSFAFLKKKHLVPSCVLSLFSSSVFTVACLGKIGRASCRERV